MSAGTPTATTRTVAPSRVESSGGDPLAEAVELTKRLKLPHIRRHLLELVPTARAQRWDHAELVRVLLAEEAAGRDAANLRTRRAHAGLPAGRPCTTGTRRVVHPAADPGRAHQPGVGRSAREPVRLRPVGHREVPLLRGP